MGIVKSKSSGYTEEQLTLLKGSILRILTKVFCFLMPLVSQTERVSDFILSSQWL